MGFVVYRRVEDQWYYLAETPPLSELKGWSLCFLTGHLCGKSCDKSAMDVLEAMKSGPVSDDQLRLFALSV
jgi:hypothetical protein